MSDDSEAEKMAEALKRGIDNNAQDSPRLNIDPDSQKMAVVGDPNNVKTQPKPYSLVFCYPEEMLSEEDKVKMQKVDGEYFATVSYPNIRVKPLYRTKVAMVVTNILVDLGVITREGYTSEMVNAISARLLTNHLTEIAEVVELVLNVPKEQTPYLNAGCLYEFFVTLLENEPNILQEGTNFLSSSQLQAQKNKT